MMEQLKEKIEKDHDIVTRLEIKVIELCLKVDKIQITLENKSTACKDCRKEIEEEIKIKTQDLISWPQFKWIFNGTMVIVFSILLWLGGVLYSNTQTITTISNKHTNIQHDELFNKIMERVEDKFINNNNRR